MSDTHPNAFRVEAADLRNQAVLLNAQADDLEAKAEELDPTPKPKKAAVKATPKKEVK